MASLRHSGGGGGGSQPQQDQRPQLTQPQPRLSALASATPSFALPSANANASSGSQSHASGRSGTATVRAEARAAQMSRQLVKFLGVLNEERGIDLSAFMTPCVFSIYLSMRRASVYPVLFYVSLSRPSTICLSSFLISFCTYLMPSLSHKYSCTHTRMHTLTHSQSRRALARDHLHDGAQHGASDAV
jgi:hypothetical protein